MTKGSISGIMGVAIHHMHQKELPMNTIPQVAEAMQTILNDTAETAARTNGLIRRPTRVKLSGAQFVQTLVFGFMADPHASREALAQTAAALDVDISPQAIDQRLTEPAAHCLEDVLAAATLTMVAADAVAVPILQRFAGVLIQDTTTVSLPET